MKLTSSIQTKEEQGPDSHPTQGRSATLAYLWIFVADETPIFLEQPSHPTRKLPEDRPDKAKTSNQK